jgi:hypothetical protein
LKEINEQKIKYFIEGDIRKILPIRVNTSDKCFYKDNVRSKSVIHVPTSITPFRITPSKVFPDMHKFIDDLCPFEHTRPEFFIFSKINALSGYISKTLTCVCGHSEFGKTSVYEVLDGITQKCPVFNPKTAAGVLTRLTEDGNLIIDEMQKVSKDIRIIIEGIATKIGDDRPSFHNGALKTAFTKSDYNISEQSMTFTYNTIDYYSEPEESFFDGSNFWDNVGSMDSRFLKFKVMGELREKFDKDFDILAEAEKNKMTYINIAKQLLYLKQLRISNGYQRRYNIPTKLALTLRKRATFNEITWLLDMYCDSKKEYEDYLILMENSIKDYAQMIGKSVKMIHKDSDYDKLKDIAEKIEVETIKDEWNNELAVWVKCSIKECNETPCNIEFDSQKPLCKKHFK